MEIGKWLDCDGPMAVGAGESGRESRKSFWKAARLCALRYTGMKRLESESGNSRSSGFSKPLMPKASKKLVICLDNSGYEVSLERRKINVSIPDSRAERMGQIRIIDESGEDYL